MHNELTNHPNRENWIKGAFKGKKRDWLAFLGNQKHNQVFTDMHGNVVAATADYLNVVFKIVMTSCPESPYMTIPDGLNLATKGRPVLWLGYYQDTTDKTATGRPGHYQSLVPVSSVEIPLGHRDEEEEVQVSPNTPKTSC